MADKLTEDLDAARASLANQLMDMTVDTLPALPEGEITQLIRYIQEELDSLHATIVSLGNALEPVRPANPAPDCGVDEPHLIAVSPHGGSLGLIRDHIYDANRALIHLRDSLVL